MRLVRRVPGVRSIAAPYRRLLDTVNIVERRVALAERRLQELREQEMRTLAALSASERARAAVVRESLQQIEASLSALAHRVDQHADEIAARLAQIEATAATHGEATAAMHAEQLYMLQRTTGRPGTYIGNGRVLFTTHWGHAMICDARDLSLTPALLHHGLFEPGTTNVFLKLVHEGMHVIEVGANIGYYTSLGGLRVGREGRYIAFEPYPRAFALLETNIALYLLYDWVEAVNKAVFDKATTLTLHTYDSRLGHTTIHRVEDEEFERTSDYSGTFTVDAVSLDEYLAGTGMHVDLVKIDAERSEPYILRGMRQTLLDNPDIQVIFEICPDTFTEEDDALYRGMGFRFWRIDLDSGELTPIDGFFAETRHEHDYHDVLMSRRDDPFA
jgi:FkbM family methyltransferase